jgi:hypothetical protein
MSDNIDELMQQLIKAIPAGYNHQIALFYDPEQGDPWELRVSNHSGPFVMLGEAQGEFMEEGNSASSVIKAMIENFR